MVGLPATQTNRAGTVCTLTFNNLNQLNDRKWNDNVTPEETYYYDLVGRPTGLYNGYTGLGYNYNDAGQPTVEYQQPDGALPVEQVDYHYDPNGCTDQVTYPTGDALLPTYTNRNQLDVENFYVAGANTTYQVADYNYNTDGTLAARYLPNGTYTGYHYDAGARIDVVANYRYSPSYKDISQRDYGHDAMGRMTWFYKLSDTSSGSSTENGKGDGYGYDADGQLTGANMEASGVNGAVNSYGDSPNAGTTPGQRANSYVYDEVGNRTQANNSGTIDTYGINANNTYSSDTNSVQGNIPISNDNRADTASFAGWNYTFDAKGQLLTAYSGSNSVQFLYDALGRRTRRYVNGVLQRIYHYDGWKVIEERNGSNQKVYSYIYGAGGELMERVAANGTPTWYHHDARGWITHLTDGNANVVEQYLYDVYGAVYVLDQYGTQRAGNATAVDNHFLWANSYEWQPELGLYLCGHRFYSPRLGRWLSPDPSGFGGGDVNWNRYCGNDPVNFVDPSGLTDSGLEPGKGIIIGGTLDAAGGAVLTLGGSVGIYVSMESENPFTWSASLVATGIPYTGVQLIPSLGVGATGHFLPGTSDLNDLNGPSAYGSINGGVQGLSGTVGVSNVGSNLSKASIDVGVDIKGDAMPLPIPITGNAGAGESFTTTLLHIPSFEEISDDIKQYLNDFQQALLNNADDPADAYNSAEQNTNFYTMTNNYSHFNSSNAAQSIFTNADSAYFGQSRWDVMGIGNQGDSNALGLDMFTRSGSGSPASSMWGWFLPKPLN